MTSAAVHPHPHRINGYFACAAICACASLWYREGRPSVDLPILGSFFALSYVIPWRMERFRALALARCVLFPLVVVLYRWHSAQEVGTVVDPMVPDEVAVLCFAELTVRAWSRNACISAATPVMLIGTVFVIAINTYDDLQGRFSTPPFVLLLLLGIVEHRVERDATAARRARPVLNLAFLVAAFFGAGLFLLVTAQRDMITYMANMALMQSHLPTRTSGLSDQSRLSSMYGQEESFDRVLGIKTEADVSHMRAGAMITYTSGAWGPGFRRGNRKYVPIDGSSNLIGRSAGEAASVITFMPLDNMILLPLNAASVDIDQPTTLRWARDSGGPLVAEPAIENYTFKVGKEDAQGPLCLPPDRDTIQALLNVPKSITPDIRALASRIVSGCNTPEQKIRAIENYLPANHKYSLTIQVDDHDPLGDFLFSNKAAHCEYFASAAVMLMRRVGIPARYVIGYYAHEREDGMIVVRQRDAHAWAEAWVKGKGWITVDATPGDGLPGHQSSDLPFWRAWTEKFQDWMTTVKQTMTPDRLRVPFLGLSGLLALYLAIRLSGRFRFKTGKRSSMTSYSVTDVDLLRLHARFERACRQCGLRCPSDVPWRDFLQNPELMQALSPSTPPEAAAIVAGRKFVDLYYEARFGSINDRALLQCISDLVSDLERISRLR